MAASNEAMASLAFQVGGGDGMSCGEKLIVLAMVAGDSRPNMLLERWRRDGNR